MRRLTSMIVVAAISTAGALSIGAQSRQSGNTQSSICTLLRRPAPLPDLPEASGLTLSGRTPGLLWSHNDSGPPVLFAVTTSGTPRGRVRVMNAAVTDWEDVTAAPCGKAACLYVADIGDNEHVRRSITVYRMTEPEPSAQTVDAESLEIVYPDGAHDAEALFVVNDDLYVITKDAEARLYRVSLRRGGTRNLEMQQIARLNLTRVTDADVSADGRFVVVRTNDEVVFYRTGDLVRGESEPSGIRGGLQWVKEPQGEGVTLDRDGTLYLSSEGGGGKKAGRLTSLRCSLP